VRLKVGDDIFIQIQEIKGKRVAPVLLCTKRSANLSGRN